MARKELRFKLSINILEMLRELVYPDPEITKEVKLQEYIIEAKRKLMETRNNLIINIFEHYVTKLGKVIKILDFLFSTLSWIFER